MSKSNRTASQDVINILTSTVTAGPGDKLLEQKLKKKKYHLLRTASTCKRLSDKCAAVCKTCFEKYEMVCMKIKVLIRQRHIVSRGWKMAINSPQRDL